MEVKATHWQEELEQVSPLQGLLSPLDSMRQHLLPYIFLNGQFRSHPGLSNSMNFLHNVLCCCNLLLQVRQPFEADLSQ